MDVASTILRRPCAIGEDRALLRVVRHRAEERADDGAEQIALGEQRLDAPDLARAREKDQEIARVVAQRLEHDAGDGGFDARAGSRRDDSACRRGTRVPRS